MLVLHAHWQPPRSPIDPGGFLFWAEMSEASAPIWNWGRLPQKPRLKNHPFCAPGLALQLILGEESDEGSAVLCLPTTRTGPLPSPGLVYGWDLDRATDPFLAPWRVEGIRFPVARAVQALIRLPTSTDGDSSSTISFVFSDEVHFWRRAATLAFEALAAQKLVPVLAPADDTGDSYHARWMPVLDGPSDAPRMVLLEAAMPPVCRAENTPQGETPARRALLTTFLNTACDSLARLWGASAWPGFGRGRRDPAARWLAALFSDDPRIDASPAQLEALASSQRAWMRNLHAAGDFVFRIAFRLEAPARQAQNAGADWQLHYLVQARDDPSLLVPAETIWKTHGNVLSEVGRRFEQPQEKLLAGLGYAGRLFPPVLASLKGKRPTQLALDANGAYSFLREAAPALEGAGFGVLVPPWWNKPGGRLGARLRMKPASGQNAVSQTKLSLEHLVSYQWELSIGETTLTEEEFRALAALKSPLVQIRGQWVQLDPAQIEAAIQFWEKQQREGQMSLMEALQFNQGAALAAGLPVDEVVAEGWLAEWLERFNHSDKLVELPQPAGLKGELRPYQRYGFSWLQFHRRWGLGACLADDMGLGKTIQTIALLLQEKETLGALPAPTLLVCPTSVVTNWEREIQRFAPSLTALVHQGAGRLRGDDFVQAAKAVDMVLTSYALVRQDIELLQSVSWLGVVLDEAQNIKNPAAKQTQAARQLPAEFRLALTGTPVENRLVELWSIMHFLNPGYLGSREKFRSRFAIPIERYNDAGALQRLKDLTGPFILRRVKTDPRVIQDLPEKVETKEYCRLTEEQATLYEAVVQDVMKQIEEKEGIERRGLVLSMLMQLKQICNHPVQYLHQAGKEGDASRELVGRSGKLERLVELLEEILSEGDRALIFTQFAEMGQLLTGFLTSTLGTGVQFLHGSTLPKARDQMVKRFQEDDSAPPIFILSLKAGGTGLNLTRANHVFHFDRWWNPAVEDQATDRAFRIGQKRNVQVHKFVTTGTLEEMVDEMIESKKGLAQAVVGSGEGWLTELSTDELRELVELRRD